MNVGDDFRRRGHVELVVQTRAPRFEQDRKVGQRLHGAHQLLRLLARDP